MFTILSSLFDKNYNFNNYSIYKKYSCSPNVSSKGFTKLMYMIINKQNTRELIQYILQNPDEINKTNNKGWTALMIVARNSNIYGNDILTLLLENGASINLQNNDGWSALMMSCKYSNENSSNETVKILLENNANIDLQENNGWSSLMLSSRYSGGKSSNDTVKILLENSANINLRNNFGRNVFDIMNYSNNVNKNIILQILNCDSDNNILNNLMINQISDSKNENAIEIECCVCMENIINNCALIPCGHSTICYECVMKLNNKCPICNNNFTNAIRIY